ncbi:hypothetical protein CEK62_04215 [Alcanivorax sp. N3-2A]|nr:hypothetical protein CEK62_04215 [Alcanivorax sp. N3-2A]
MCLCGNGLQTAPGRPLSAHRPAGGEQQQRHLDEVARWQSEGVVEYLGEQDDVRPWLAESHVLVLPSYREGMPRTVLEAASMGRPAIVSDVPGCRQAVEKGVTGWLCQVRDADSLAECMEKCWRG